MSQAAVASPAQTDTTQFDMSSAVPETEDGKAVSAMPAFDLSSAVPEDQLSKTTPQYLNESIGEAHPEKNLPEDQAAPLRQEAFDTMKKGIEQIPDSPASKAVRWWISNIGRGGLEEFKEADYDYSHIQAEPTRNEGESDDAFNKRFEAFRQPLEDAEISKGVMGQLNDTFTGAIAMAAPEMNVAAWTKLGTFMAADTTRRAVQNILAPNMTASEKDLMDIVSFLPEAGLAHSAVEGLGEMFSNAFKAKGQLPVVDLPPEHVAAIAGSRIPDEAKADLMDRLGVTQAHVDASVASGKPIRVPIVNLMDMAESPHWGEIVKNMAEDKASETNIETPEAKAIEEEKKTEVNPSDYKTSNEYVEAKVSQEFDGKPLGSLEYADKMDSKEGILTAAISSNDKIYTGATHMQAIDKAVEAGDAIWNESSGKYTSPDGTKLIGDSLFITDSGKLVDRNTASEGRSLFAGGEFVSENKETFVPKDGKRAGYISEYEDANKPISPMTGGLQEETGKFGEHNKLFTEEMANKARESLSKRMSGSKLHDIGSAIGDSAGALGDLLKIGGYHFEGGVREFGAWSTKMISEFGDAVKPHLQDIWDKIQKQAPKMAQPKVEATESELNKNKYVKPVKLDFVGKEKKGSIDFRRTGDDMRKKFIGAINEAKTKVNYLAEDNTRLVKDVTQRNGQAIYADRGGDIEAIKKDMEDIESSLEEGSESEKWWNEEGKASYEAALNPTEEMLQGIKEGNQYYREAGQVAKYHKTISTVRDNYVNRAWRRAVSKGLIETDKHDNPSGYTGHRQNRVFPFIADGIKAKFIPETLDYSKLMSMHGEEMAYANVGNAFAEQSIPLKFGGWVDSDSVKEGQMQVGTMKRDLPQKNKDGTIKIDPKTGNQEIRHQVFVAPEGIAKAMGPVVDPDFLRQIDQFQNAKGLNQVVKNANVMLGMFHDKQFIIQKLSSISGPEGVKDALTGKIPEKLFTEDFRKGELEYIKTGLGTTPEYENVDIAKDMDKIEGSLKDAPGIKQANALIDAHTKNLFNVWGRYFKVDNFIRNKAAWDLKNPDATPQERVEAYRGIAQAANNTFGGHGWAGLGVSKSITSAARFTFFASDWLYSAVRNTGAAVGDWKVGNWRTVADSSGMEGHIARTTILKGLLYGAVATEGINYMLTGHTTDKNSKGHKLEVEFDNNTHLSLFGGATGELVKFLSDFGERGIDGATNYFTYKASPVMRLLGMVATHKNYAGGDIWSEDGGAGKFLADHVPEQYQDGVKHAVNGMVELLSTISPIPFAAEPAILGKIGSDIKDMATNSGENLGDKIKKGVGDVGLVTGLTRYSVGESDARKQQDIDTEVEKGLEKKDDTAANKYLASGDISQAKIDELQAKADETPLEKSYKNLSIEKILKKADGNIDSMDADDKDALKTMLDDKYDRMQSAGKASPNEIKRIGDLLEDFYDKHKIQ